jgi:hypothetical protein
MLKERDLFEDLGVGLRIVLSRVWSDYRWGFGLDIGVIDHLYTQLVTTSNYSAIANFHTLQITSVHAKYFSVCNVFASSCLVMVSNSGCFWGHVLSEWWLPSN